MKHLKQKVVKKKGLFFNPLLMIITLFLAVNCSTINQKTTQGKSYKKTTHNKRKAALEKYKLMRFVDWKNYKKTVKKRKQQAPPQTKLRRLT